MENRGKTLVQFFMVTFAYNMLFIYFMLSAIHTNPVEVFSTQNCGDIGFDN
jgi:hypothetical protein